MNFAIKIKLPFLVAIGLSAGGPGTLVKVLKGIPEDQESAIVILQHFNESMTIELLEWLRASTGKNIRLPVNGESIAKGAIYLAPSDGDIELTATGVFRYSPGDLSSPYAPSIDRFFLSIAKYSAPVLGVVMTGMGEDGARGLLKLKNAGQGTIAQDEASSIVTSMPRAAIRLGAAERVLSIEGIVEAIREFNGKCSRRGYE